MMQRGINPVTKQPWFQQSTNRNSHVIKLQPDWSWGPFRYWDWLSSSLDFSTELHIESRAATKMVSKDAVMEAMMDGPNWRYHVSAAKGEIIQIAISCLRGARSNRLLWVQSRNTSHLKIRPSWLRLSKMQENHWLQWNARKYVSTEFLIIHIL